MSLFHRLKERALFQWVAAYAAAAWLGLEVVSFLADTFTWSPTIVRGSTIAAGVGLAIAVVVAWYHGEKGRQRVTGTELLLLAGILATGGGLMAIFGPADSSQASQGLVVGSPSRALLDEDRQRRVAVLPFTNMSTDPDADFFADGVHESVITRLSLIRDLRVLSPAAVAQFKDSPLTDAEIADQLAAGAVLRGSVRRAGDQIRVSAQLVDPFTAETLWGEELDGTIADLFELQSTVAVRVAEELEAALSPGERSAIARPLTDDSEALDFFLRARRVYRSVAPGDLEEGIRLYRRATDLDPDFASAWAGMATAYMRGVQSFGYPFTYVDSAAVLAERARGLAPDLPDGYLVAGYVEFARGRNAEATDWFLQALERSPGLQAATSNLGFTNLFTGRWDEALRWARRAYELDPTSAQVREMLSNSYQDLLEFEIAERWLQEALDRDPRSPLVRRQAQALEILRGRPEVGYAAYSAFVEESGVSSAYVSVVGSTGAHFAREFEDAIEWTALAMEQGQGGRLSDYHDVRVVRALALRRTGSDEDIEPLLSSAEADYSAPVQNGADSWVFPLVLAAIHLVRGSTDEGLGWFEAANEGGFNGWNLIEVDPVYDDVRDHPRYRAVIDDMRMRLEDQRRSIEEEERAQGLRG